MRPVLWLAYQVLRVWWYVARPHHDGAVIAIWFEGRVIMVWHSYRDALSVPGGGLHGGESALDAAIRETREEIGISLDPRAVSLAMETTERWEFRYDHVRIFETTLDAAPMLKPDGREVVAARLMDPRSALSQKLPPFLRRYLEQKAPNFAPLRLDDGARAGAAGKD
jgi:8-oxo-dGTP diphosphatase